jgi:hypothetical protein
LAIECLPHARRGAVAPELWVSGAGAGAGAGASLAGRSWSLPGLEVEVATAPESVEVVGGEDELVKVRFPVGTTDVSLRLAAT